jgi:hypothetical protein
MSETPNLALPFLAASQAQKHVTLNESLLRLDALAHLAVASRILTAPPVEPVDGDRYLVPAGATGDWAGQSGKIAARADGAWSFLAPRTGWRAWIADERRLVVRTAAGWEEAHRTSPLHASCELGNVVTCDPSGAWNDFDWPGWNGDHPGRATHIRLMPAAPLILTGLAGGAAARLALLSNATAGADGNLVVVADASEQSSAGNRFRFSDRLPRFLMPGDTLAVVYDADEAAWVEIGRARFRDLFDVFADTLSPAGLDASLSGAGAHSAAAGASWRIATGTTAAGAARWGSPAGSLRLGGDGVLFLGRLAVETLSGWPDRFILRAGLHDAGLGPSPASGAWWEYDASLASTWRRCTASAAGVTRDSGGFPVGTGPAWLGVFVDPAAACADFIYSADGRSWQVDGGRHPLAATSPLAFGIDIAKSEGETERGALVGFAAVRAAGRHAP